MSTVESLTSLSSIDREVNTLSLKGTAVDLSNSPSTAKVSKVAAERFMRHPSSTAYRAALHAQDFQADLAGVVRAGVMTAECALSMQYPDRADYYLGLDSSLTATSLYSALIYGPMYAIKLNDDMNRYYAEWRERGFSDATVKNFTDAWVIFDAGVAASTAATIGQRSLALTAEIAKGTHNTTVANAAGAGVASASTMAYVFGLIASLAVLTRGSYELNQIRSLRGRISSTIKTAQGEMPYSKALSVLNEERSTSISEVLKSFRVSSSNDRNNKLENLFIQRRINQAMDVYKNCQLDQFTDPEVKKAVAERKKWNSKLWQKHLLPVFDLVEKELTDEKKSFILAEFGIYPEDKEKKVLFALSGKAFLGFCIAYQDKLNEKEAKIAEYLGDNAYQLLKTSGKANALFLAKAGVDASLHEKDNEKVVKTALDALSLNPFNKASNQKVRWCLVLAAVLMIISSVLILATPPGAAIAGALLLAAAICWGLGALTYAYADYKYYKAKEAKEAINIHSKQPWTKKIAIISWCVITITIVAFGILCMLNPVSAGIIAAFALLYFIYIATNIYVFHREGFNKFCGGVAERIRGVFTRSNPVQQTIAGPTKPAVVGQTLSNTPSQVKSEKAQDIILENITSDLMQKLILEQFKKRHLQQVTKMPYKNNYVKMLSVLSLSEKEVIKRKFKASAQTSIPDNGSLSQASAITT